MCPAFCPQSPEHGDCRIPFYAWETFDNIVNQLLVFQRIENALPGNLRANEHRRVSQDLRVRKDDAF